MNRESRYPTESEDHLPHNFADGPLLVKETTNSYAFHDEEGRPAIAEKFKRARPFSEGLAAVSDVSYNELLEDSRLHLSRVSLLLPAGRSVRLSIFPQAVSALQSWHFYAPLTRNTAGVSLYM